MNIDPMDAQVAGSRHLSLEKVRQLKRTRGLSAAALAALPEAALRRAVRRLDYPDLARARVEFRRRQARNDQGMIPFGAHREALNQLRRLHVAAATPSRVAGLPAGPGVAPATLLPPPTAGLNPAHTGWVYLGPGNIGGRTRSIVVHPTTPDTMWAGSVGGGVWQSTNGGGAWQPVDDMMADLAVSCLAMDPSRPTTIYAGTGEGFANLDAIRGAGVFRTVDGVHWSQLSSTTTADFQAINRLAVSKDGTLLLAATGTGLFRSADPARLTWTRALAGPIADVKFHPTDSSRVIAGDLRNGQAHYSTDGGLTWQPATHAQVWTGRVELTYAAGNPSMVYASVQMNTGQIWRSIDGGQNFTPRNTQLANGTPANYLGDQGWYGNSIWAGDPTNTDLVIAGGVDLWRSTDGGNTLIDISTWWDPRSVHADHHAIVSHPGYDGAANKSVFFGNDGGLFKTGDVTAAGSDPAPPRISGWTDLDNTYGVTELYGAAGNSGTGVIVGGAQDNGTLCFTPAGGTNRWTSIFGGDGGWCAADPSNPQIFYGEYVYLSIHRNMDGGATGDTQGDRYITGMFWNSASGGWDWKPSPYSITDAQYQRALFVAPFILDPQQPKRMLAGGLSLWRTEDATVPNTDASGPSWSEIKPAAGGLISAIAVAPNDSNTIWVGHEDGQVYKTANGTDASPTWQRMDNTGGSPLEASRYCTRIALDPHALGTVYVTYGGYQNGNVWKSTDAGATWKDISGTLPQAPARALTMHPRKPNLLYLGTEVGILASEDGGTTWSPTNEGPTNCSVDDLLWMGQTLVCASHGRGMFKIDLSGV